jgi:uncharacterized membrane protein
MAQEAIADGEAALAKFLHGRAIDELNDEEFESARASVTAAIAKKFENDATDKGTKSKVTAALASKVLSKEKTGETGAVTANTVAWYANPIMWIALVIAAVIAAIVALISYINACNETLERASTTEKLKEARAEAERLNEEFEKAKNKVADLES